MRPRETYQVVIQGELSVIVAIRGFTLAITGASTINGVTFGRDGTVMRDRCSESNPRQREDADGYAGGERHRKGS